MELISSINRKENNRKNIVVHEMWKRCAGLNQTYLLNLYVSKMFVYECNQERKPF